jgi:DNA-directed RNA polymerase I subunit RPA49
VCVCLDEIEKEADRNRLIPPFNAITSAVDEVYSINDLISQKEMDSLSVEQFMEVKPSDILELKSSNKYGAFVTERLLGSIRVKDRRRLRLLTYLNYLLKFRGLRDSQLNKKNEFYVQVGTVPRPIEQALFDKFTEAVPGKKEGSTKYSMSALKKSLLTAYICALALHIDSFSVNPKLLAQDLGITATKTGDLFRQLGCQVDPKSKECKLVAPVQFPKPRKGRK